MNELSVTRQKGFYIRLSVNNIRKNGKTYFPYILTCIMTVMVFYMVKSLSLNPGISQLVGADTVNYTMDLGTKIIRLFALIFLFYTNSFLMKRRKKEFGLFNILGMEKKHLARILFMETFLTTILSLGIGLLFGIALDKVMFLLLLKIVGAEVPLGFFIAPKAIETTVIYFCVVFALIYLKSVFTLSLSNPIELLRGGNMGEKEPRAKWVIALFGAVMLGIAYYLALTIKNPVTSITAFFVAVLLVILATYLLFTAGSITILKLMRRNKRFYYKAKHFISVSGMIYRMKQNAVGLANICILSTMVLVTVSSTTSLMVGIEDVLHTRYPNDLGIYSRETDESRNKEIFGQIDNICDEMNLPNLKKLRYTYMDFSVLEYGDEFIDDDSGIDIVSVMDRIRLLIFIPLSDFNACTGGSYELSGNELLLYCHREQYPESSMRLFGQEYHVKERLNDLMEFTGTGAAVSNIASAYYCIIGDADFDELIQAAGERLDNPYYVYEYYGIDTSADAEIQEELYVRMLSAMQEFGFRGYIESRQKERVGFMTLYGGLFFLGIFLGLLFIMAAVLIIYYKQISEGYDDRERFIIMQKVGMTKAEVKRAIRSQVLTVFFLPLIVAGIHVAVAFHMISLILALLNMVNVNLYLICTAACFLVFAAMYVLVYSLTAKTYYKIVSS